MITFERFRLLLEYEIKSPTAWGGLVTPDDKLISMSIGGHDRYARQHKFKSVNLMLRKEPYIRYVTYEKFIDINFSVTHPGILKRVKTLVLDLIDVGRLGTGITFEIFKRSDGEDGVFYQTIRKEYDGPNLEKPIMQYLNSLKSMEGK